MTSRFWGYCAASLMTQIADLLNSNYHERYAIAGVIFAGLVVAEAVASWVKVERRAAPMDTSGGP